MVRAKLFWKDGTQMQTIQRHCLMKVRQKRKSDNATPLPWKTIPMRLHLKKGDDGKGTGKLFLTKEYKARQDNGLISRSTLKVDCTKNMLSVPDKEISQSIQHNKEGKILNNNLMNTRSTPKRFTLELDGNIILQQDSLHPRSGSRTMNGSRIKVGSVGDLQPGLNSKKI